MTLPMIIEQLDNGGIRYSSADGVVTGRQVGMFAVRDTAATSPYDLHCHTCQRLIAEKGTSIWIVDFLTMLGRVCSALTHEGAAVYADDAHRPHDATIERWLCAQFDRELKAERWQTFNEWRRAA